MAKGFGKTLTVGGLIASFILLVILYRVGAALLPDFTSAAGALNTAGIGLGSIIAGSVMLVIIGAAFVYATLKEFGVVN